MYKALYYLSRTIQAIMALFVIAGISGMASEVGGIGKLIDAFLATPSLLIVVLAPLAIFTILSSWVVPKLQARINPEKEVIEDRKE
jgi:hypothetical protein